MTEYFKLTDENGETFNQTRWAIGTTHSGTGKGDLCGEGWIYVYTDPLLAVLLNSIHADFIRPRLFKGVGSGKAKSDDGLKVGVETFTATEELPLPVVTTKQRVRFGILCAISVYSEPNFVRWATAWLAGRDQSHEAAQTAVDAAWGTRTAANVAEGAVWEVPWKAAWESAWAAAGLPWKAEVAANAAARAGTILCKPLDLVALAKEAMRVGE